MLCAVLSSNIGRTQVFHVPFRFFLVRNACDNALLLNHRQFFIATAPSLIRGSCNHHFNYSATIMRYCVLPYHWSLGFLLSTCGLGIFNVRNGFSACCAREGEMGTDDRVCTTVDPEELKVKRSFTLSRPEVKPMAAAFTRSLTNKKRVLTTELRPRVFLRPLGSYFQNRTVRFRTIRPWTVRPRTAKPEDHSPLGRSVSDC